MTDAEAVAAYLSDPSNAVSVREYAWDSAEVRRAGLYSWWVDGQGAAVLERSLGEALPSLIYAGQTGATSELARKPSTATLRSRIHGNHLNGNAHGSTFRKTLSALLIEPLGLVVEGVDRLEPAANRRVSQWMRDHLSIAVFPFDDQEELGRIEATVLRLLDPPLNLNGVGPSTIRRRVSQLRRSLTRPEPRVMVPAPVTPVGRVRYMIPTIGPDSWRLLLAEPNLHWARGRSARTLAYCWETADGWPPEVEALLKSDSKLARFRPIYGFPEFKTPLPGGRRASQTDLLVLATDGTRGMTMGVEGKVDESFGPVSADWLGEGPSDGKRERIAFLADLLRLNLEAIGDLRYQLIHRAAAAKIEAARHGSDVAVMLVHSWGPAQEGFDDYARFAHQLGVEAGLGEIGFSTSAGLWLGWAVGDPRWLDH
jgi:hypothetical protein